MSHWDEISIAILAGGQSTRMGQDKAALEVHGQAMLSSVASLARSTGAVVCIVGRARADGWPSPLAVDFVPDALGSMGPLAGLMSALQWNQRARLLLLPCDLPLLEASALDWIAGEASTCLAPHGLAATRGAMLEPMFSVYFAPVQEHARQYAASGRRSLHGLIESGGFERRECPAEVAAQLFNCNTPHELEEARSAAKKRGGRNF